MFTGIVQEVGNLLSLRREGPTGRVEIASSKVVLDARPGDSICCNGVCLTVTEIRGGRFTADLSRETLERSAYAHARLGDAVNLEPALRPTDRLGGHLVSGHVDGTGSIVSLDEEGDAWVLKVRFPERLAPYIAEKGSLCVDGMSLTVTYATKDEAGFAIIPFTIENTNLRNRRPGDPVNLEVDILARYVERLLSFSSADRMPGGLTVTKLQEYGFINP